MSDWQLIDETTPRGVIVNRPTKIKGKTVMREKFIHQRIEVVGGPDTKIRISCWWPSRKAWEWYTEKNPPKYWRPLPDLPEEYR